MHHLLVRIMGRIVHADLQKSVTEDAVGIAVVRIDLDGLTGIDSRWFELVTRIKNVCEVAYGTGICRSDLKGFFECFFGAIKVVWVAGFPRLANQRITQPVKCLPIARITLDQLLVIGDLGVRPGGLSENVIEYLKEMRKGPQLLSSISIGKFSWSPPPQKDLPEGDSRLPPVRHKLRFDAGRSGGLNTVLCRLPRPS